MKVLLAIPPISKRALLVPDLGLGYLATALIKHAHEVFLLQHETVNSIELVIEQITYIKPDVIGLKLYSLHIHKVKQLVNTLHRLFPSLVIILGGPHVAAAPEQVLRYFEHASFAIRGEAEISLPALLQLIESGDQRFDSIPGLIYRTNGAIHHNPLLVQQNIDAFGFPAWHLMNPVSFPNRFHFWSPEHPAAPVITSRGCPYQCAFCTQNVVTGKVVRRRSIDHVINELELLKSRYGIGHIDFNDDNFAMHRGYVRALCEQLMAQKLNLRWNCCSRIEHLDIELVKLMERAGCSIISIGFESGSERILNLMRKPQHLIDNRIITKQITRQTNIKLMGFFILGYPTETRQEIEQTITYSLSLPLFVATYTTYIPFPGCEQYDRLLQAGEITEVAWEKLDQEQHCYAPVDMTLFQLKRLFTLAYFRFYRRPSIWISILLYTWQQFPLLFAKALQKFLWSRYF